MMGFTLMARDHAGEPSDGCVAHVTVVPHPTGARFTIGMTPLMRRILPRLAGLPSTLDDPDGPHAFAARYELVRDGIPLPDGARPLLHVRVDDPTGPVGFEWVDGLPDATVNGARLIMRMLTEDIQ